MESVFVLLPSVAWLSVWLGILQLEPAPYGTVVSLVIAAVSDTQAKIEEKLHMKRKWVALTLKALFAKL